MNIHNFKELVVWQKAIELASFTYSLTNFFPKEEKYGFTSQIQRSAISIPSNIAEGCGRVSTKELQHFIAISMGSAYEIETQIILAHKFQYISDEQRQTFEQFVQSVQKMLYGLYNSLNKQVAS